MYRLTYLFLLTWHTTSKFDFSIPKWLYHLRFLTLILYLNFIPSRCKWVPVTTAWRVLRLRTDERPPICRVAANILNK
jgi:hypothetical protein